MDLHTRLRKALDPLPDGALVPVSWLQGFLEEEEGDRLGDYTVEEVGQVLDRAPSTVRTWIGQGRLRAYRLGREWRVTREAIRELRNGGGGGEGRRKGEEADLGAWRGVGSRGQ